MKIWEVMEELSRNPEKVFRLNGGAMYYILKTDVADGFGGENFYLFEAYYSSGEKMSETSSGANFNGNTSPEDDWSEVVRERISFQTALQLWLAEEDVYCEGRDGEKYHFLGIREQLVDQNERPIDFEQITMFNWFKGEL